MNKNYQIILYGATGFTGKLCAEYFRENYPDLNWAIAGRNKNKLEALKSELNLDCDIFVADSDDYEAIKNFVKQTKVVLSAAGPFARYSTKVVEACVECKTHYTDITGENHWVKGLIDRFHEKAALDGTRIVPSCGYDSIPSDLGVYFSVTRSNQPVTHVTVYHSAKGGASGGTTETMFTMGPLPKEMRDPFLLNPQDSVSETKKRKSLDNFSVKPIPGTDAFSGMGLMAFANTRVVRRSSALFDLNQKSYGPDFTFKELGSYPSKAAARITSLVLMSAFLVIATPLRHLVRPLLPKPGDGPDKEARDNGWFRGLFIAELEDGSEKRFEIYGSGDPGYKSTSKMVCEAALTLAFSDDLPFGNEFGGVLTSAVGLGDPLISRLMKAGITFEALS